MLDRRRQELDDRQQRMATQQQHRLQLLRQRLSGISLRLQALSPRATLERGYAIVSRRRDGAVVTRRDQVRPGDGIDVRISDGHFGGTVDQETGD